MKLFSVVAVFLFTCVPSISHGEEEFSFGLGLGIRYAGLGVSGEYYLRDNISLHLGVGKLVNITGTIGANYYFHESDANVRYRATVYYGRVASLTGVGESDEDFFGASIGVGLLMEHFEFSVFFSDMSEFDDRVKDVQLEEAVGSFAISFGYIF